ncbi:hypothetical protein [Methylobacterium sp. ARG-1]|uniref:hypothetical protein n=1 Tax=Methylobacterium sp. ARG-1 TaxID=1692501 RepID=UPI000680D934|nr:hypothetical protein [Methylobacterium sp. ARG-1]KNY21077.1 hypothetical protein AKJ13_18935 [Methylobacterium sp. ARG-1]
MADPDFQRRVRRLRVCAALRGIYVPTACQAVSPDNLGGVMLTNIAGNTVLAGSRFDLSIGDAEHRVPEMVADFEAKSLRFGGGR